MRLSVWIRPLRIAVLAGAVASAAALAAAAEAEAWRVLPAVPPLQVRFDPAVDPSGPAAPCAALPTTPEAATVECWAAYVDRAASKRSSPLTAETNLACVETWEVEQPGAGSCPGTAAACVRPDLKLLQRLSANLPIDTNISSTWAHAADLAREYTSFQVLRSGFALNPHRPRIAGLALSHGMLVLYRANAISALGRELAGEGCGAAHIQPYLDLAAKVTTEIGRSDVPNILETYPPSGREWSRRFYRVQLGVLGRPVGVLPRGAWKTDCEKAAELGLRVGRLDADVNVWCGYAYEQLAMPEAALTHWRLARRSPHHPAAASYANGRLGVRIAPVATTVGLR